jgi:serine protease Do
MKCLWRHSKIVLLLLELALFAMPAAYALRSRAPAVQHVEGYLGIGFHDVSGEDAAALHLKSTRGAEVEMVDHDGPAGKAGLRPKDIITALNGQMIDSAAMLKRLIHEAGTNVSVALQIVRGGRPMTVTAKLSSRENVERDAQARLAAAPPPPEDAGPPSGLIIQSFTETYAADAPSTDFPAKAPKSQTFLSSMLRSGPFTGLGLEDMAPQLKAFFGVGQGPGLLVDTVASGSPAALAGVHVGDVLVRVDGLPMRSTGDWTKRLRYAKGHAMAMVVMRDRHEQTLMLTPDLKHRSSLERWPLVKDFSAAIVVA